MIIIHIAHPNVRAHNSIPTGGPQHHHVPSEPQEGVCRLLRTEQDCRGDGGRHRQPHDRIQQEPVTELPHEYDHLIN